MAVALINPNSTAAMTATMTEVARHAAPELSFEGITSTKAPAAIQGPEDGTAAEPHLLELVSRSAAQGAEGIIIGCFDDTALLAASTRVPCPVVGIGQTAFHYAALRNWSFSVVTTLSVSVPVIEANIAAQGLTGFQRRVRASDVPVLELEHAPEAAAQRILQEALVAQEQDQIDALILGCAGMTTVVEQVRNALDIPVIDPVVCATQSLRWLL